MIEYRVVMSPVCLSPIVLKHVSVLPLQNNVYPLLALGVKATQALADIDVEIDYSPAYVQPQVCRVERLEAGESVALSLPMSGYEHEKLMQLTEPIPGNIRITVKSDGAPLLQEELTIHWHPHDTWVGGHQFPELLAALVRPNDPAIGLLLFWVFIWLLFWGIPALVRGICALARKLCYKEVAA